MAKLTDKELAEIRCDLLHLWSKWSKPYQVSRYLLPKQERTCTRCGFVETRSVI